MEAIENKDIEKNEVKVGADAPAPTKLAVDNSQARRWLLTINGSENQSDDFKAIIQEDLKNLRYACMSDEIGLESHVYHTHIYLSFNKPVRFITIKNLFPTAHIDCVNGTSEQCRDYVFKQGKWELNKKSETNLKNTHYEYGTIENNQGKRSDLEKITEMLEAGKSNYEIKKIVPSAFRYGNYMDAYREEHNSERFRHSNRDVKVTYVFGVSGSGKSSHIYETYGYDDVYFSDPGEHPFDTYEGQNILVFDDFRDDQIKCAQMLRYLDIYPLMLPCRFHNKVACYENVIITSNIPLQKMYQYVDTYTREAFIRRISEYYIYDMDYIYQCENIDGKWEIIDRKINTFSKAYRDKQKEYNFVAAFDQLLSQIDFDNSSEEDD